jgi:hypothetical protein
MSSMTWHQWHPNSLKVVGDELVFGAGLLEDGVGPWLPVKLVGEGGAWECEGERGSVRMVLRTRMTTKVLRRMAGGLVGSDGY